MPSLSPAAIETLARRALVGSGASESNAGHVAASIAAAEADDMRPLGLGFLPTYCEHLRCGKVDGRAVPTLTTRASGSLLVDAAHGFAHPAIVLGRAPLLAAARLNGIAMLGIRRSYACGAVGHLVEPLAEAGCIALAFANAPANVAPWGGRTPLFGTNPLAFAAPRAGGRAPLVVDLASSTVTKVALMAKIAAGEPVPEGWALDAKGLPTTDPEAARTGSMAPAGGHKGAALALMVELLAAGLTGARFSRDASPFGSNEGGPPAVGQLLVAIDATVLDPDAIARFETLFAAMLSQDGVRLPGDRRLAARRRAAERGIEVPDGLLRRIEAYAGDLS